jgi:3'(2'), 5'-bisphosphate nucleotidase
MPLDLPSLLPGLHDIASRAGEAIMAVYAGPFELRRKADQSPVTLADEAAEQVILDGLSALTPGIPAVSEEQVAATGAPQTVPARFWLVDPLDGTREFVRRNGEFTVNIALVEENRPVLGLVHVPARGETFASAGPGTASRRAGDAPVTAIAARRAPLHGIVVTHSRSHGDDAALAAYLAPIEIASRIITGSAVKFCLLAAGEADLYPRFGETSEWDTAAGHAILEAAGGSVTTLDGTPLRYGKPGFRNPPFIARGQP